jgi:hypothetical protein
LPAWFANSSFGLPHPGFWEIFVLQDDIVIEPPMYLVFSGFALGTLVGARRPVAAAQRTRDGRVLEPS